jgi:hypothetical protein
LKREGEQSQPDVQEEIPFNDRCGRWWPDGKLKYDDFHVTCLRWAISLEGAIVLFVFTSDRW